MVRRWLAVAAACALTLACDRSATEPDTYQSVADGVSPVDSANYQVYDPTSYPWNRKPCEARGTTASFACGVSYTPQTGAQWLHLGQWHSSQPAPITDPIEIVFAQPIYKVAVIAPGDRTCLGGLGTVTAHGPSGTYGPSDFVLSVPLDCGADQVTNLAELVLPAGAAITRIVITHPEHMSFYLPDPPYVDKQGRASVGYAVVFDNKPPCPPMGEPLLDDAEFRDTLSSFLARSVLSGAEEGGVVWRDQVTGQRRFVPMDMMVSQPCQVTGQYTSNTTTEVIEAIFHTHPYLPWATVMCGTRSVRYDPYQWGGGSVTYDIQTGQYGGDWANAVRISTLPTVGYPVPSYIIDRQNYYRLDPFRNGVPTTVADWGDTLHHKSWVVDPPTCRR